MTSEDKMSMSLDEIIKQGVRGRRGGTRARGRSGDRGLRHGGGRGRGVSRARVAAVNLLRDGVRGNRSGRGGRNSMRGGGRAAGRAAGRVAGQLRSFGLQARSWSRGLSRQNSGASRGNAGRGRGFRWMRSRSRSRPRENVAGVAAGRVRSRSRGPTEGARGRSRSGGGGDRSRSRSRSRPRPRPPARSLSRSRSLPRLPRSNRRSRSRSRLPPGAGRGRSRSRSSVRTARSLTPVARGSGRRQFGAGRLVLFGAASGAQEIATGTVGGRLALFRGRAPRRFARFPTSRTRPSARPVAGMNEWKMAGTFRSDYIQHQRNYQPIHNNVAGSSDIYLRSDEVGGNQLLVNIQNEYAMHPAPGARRAGWQRTRGLRRNEMLCFAGGQRTHVDLAASGDATYSVVSSPSASRQTVALRGSSRNTTTYGLPRKMTDTPAQLVPTLVVEQNIMENMGQPSANATRMTLSERFSKRNTSDNESETVFIQSDN